MKFVCAQQDNMYMIWQVYVMLSNFRRHGIEDKAVVLFAYEYHPSPLVQILRQQTTATILEYPDRRVDKSYVASVYFDLVATYLHQHPTTEPLFLHDNDIVFRELPDFDALLDGEVSCLSDCTNYLGHELYDEHSYASMAQQLGMTYADVCRSTIGGAQYLIKRSDAAFWRQMVIDSTRMHHFMKTLKPVKGKKTLDPWMAGMWTLQWSLWKAGVETATTPELDFTWPTYSAKTWDETKILHNAGVAPHQSRMMFHKGSYVERSPWMDDLSYVSRSLASWYYAQEVERAKRVFNPCF